MKTKRMIPFHCMLLLGAMLVVLPEPASAESAVEQADWGRFFKRFEAEGTMVIADERSGSGAYMTFNGVRAGKRFSPASTFKVPHALFALDAGVIRDEFEVIARDGEKKSNPAWNRDQNLRSSMRHSVVWVYEEFARRIGKDNGLAYLKKIRYGNVDPTGANPFWINGNLRISAHEQLAFLRKLHRNELPFSVSNQRLVKDVMIVEAGRDWILRGKTGWNGKVGWRVGWVENPSGAVFFALNADTPGGTKDLPKLESITRLILGSLGALKPDTDTGDDGNNRETSLSAP